MLVGSDPEEGGSIGSKVLHEWQYDIITLAGWARWQGESRVRVQTYFESIAPSGHTTLGAMPSNSVSSNIFTSLYYYAASTNYRVRNTKTYGF